jgi:hypothetical protein
MANWRQYVGGMAVLSTNLVLAQVNGPLDLRLQPGVIILDGNVPLNGLPTWPPTDVSLPLVNDGFANDQDVKGPIKPLIEALKSSEFTQREDATRTLLRLPPGRLPEVVEALSHETDAEAIERMTQVAGHLFLKPRTLLKTRASLFAMWFQQPNLSLLGLKFRMDPVRLPNLAPNVTEPTMTVMITEIQLGFPAMQTLRNGDRIVAMGGVGFPPNIPADDSTYFRSRVAALWPGSVVAMTILREGKLLELGVQVSGLPLDGPASPDAMVSMRQAALNTFLQTLKTGDKSQVRLSVSPSEIPQPQVIILRGGWGGDVLVPANENPVPRQ